MKMMPLSDNLPIALRFKKWKSYDPATAIDEICETLLHNPEFDPIIFSTLLDISTRAAVEQAQSLMSSALTKLVRFNWTREYAILHGALNFSKGDRQSAYEKFTAASSRPGHWVRYHRGANNISLWTDEPSWLRLHSRRPELRGPVQWVLEGRPSNLTIVCVGDVVYFKRYAKKVLFDLTGSVTPVHFHVVGWDQDCQDLAGQLEHTAHISISFESYIHNRDYTYFATSRFLRAFEFLRMFGPIYISDLDNTFNRMPEDLFKLWRLKDIGIKHNQWTPWLPWLSPNAGYVFLNDTPRALHFALLMANYIDHKFVPNQKNNWYFDQLLLNEVLAVTDASEFSFVNNNRPAVGRTPGSDAPDEKPKIIGK